MWVRDTAKKVWRIIREMFSQPAPNQSQAQQQPSGSSPLKQPAPEPEPGTEEEKQPRYDVQNESGESVAQADSLSEAHRQWQRKTGENGRIIDTETGQDVTPPKDDDGRYVVLDENDQQISSHANKEEALKEWREKTNENGRVVDLLTKQDITPRPKDAYMSKGQMQLLMEHLGHSRGIPAYTQLQIDPYLVQQMIEQINQKPLPVFDISNIIGQGNKVPTKTVPIKRQRVKIEKRRRQVREDAPGPPQPSGTVPVPYATDKSEGRRMRGAGDIVRLRPSQMALPDALLQQRIATNDFMVEENLEELPATPTVSSRLVWEEYEEPVVETWEEEVEVAESPEAQLVEGVVDVSGSMWGTNMNLAVAALCTLIGRHQEDGSIYMYRPFGDEPGSLRVADTPSEIKSLLRHLVEQKEHHLGGGTHIIAALEKAAGDVRRRANQGQTPQIVLITDGQDALTSSDVFSVIGHDVILHTIIVGPVPNYDLKRHSSTYCQLDWNGYTVSYTRGDEMPDYDRSW